MELTLDNLKLGMPLYVKVKNNETGDWEVKNFTVSSIGSGALTMTGESGTELIHDIDLNTRIYADEDDCKLDCAGLNGNVELFESLMLKRGIDLSDPDVFDKFVKDTIAGASNPLQLRT